VLPGRIRLASLYRGRIAGRLSQVDRFSKTILKDDCR